METSHSLKALIVFRCGWQFAVKFRMDEEAGGVGMLVWPEWLIDGARTDCCA
jgi:hypothetical protein